MLLNIFFFTQNYLIFILHLSPSFVTNTSRLAHPTHTCPITTLFLLPFLCLLIKARDNLFFSLFSPLFFLMDIYHWALQPQRTGILKLVWAPHAEWANEDLIQRLLESILAFDLSLFYPCWWLMSVVKTPGRRLLWFAVVAVETLMSRVVLIFEITFKIHYLPSLERSWKSSTWRSNQTPPVAPFSLPWLDLSFLKLATLQPTALVTPSTIPEELCAGFGDPQPPASLRFQAGRLTSHICPVVFHRNISKSIPSWQGAIILIALPRRQSKAKICPRKRSLASHTPIPSSWPSTDITLHKHEDLK